MGDLGPDQFMCAYCQVQANQRCTGCHETFYCSREHQKLHWKKHKNHCCAFKVMSIDISNQYQQMQYNLRKISFVILHQTYELLYLRHVLQIWRWDDTSSQLET